MLNPDGVIFGNHRCSVVGVDLNRRWSAPSRVLHPVIYSAKKFIKTVSQEREIIIFCDIHGHFRKKEAFMYCCSFQQEQVFYDCRYKNAFLRILPLFLSQKNPQFSFRESKFRMEKYKESTARIVLFRELGIVNSFTLENSFFRTAPEPPQLKSSRKNSDNVETAQTEKAEPTILEGSISVIDQVKQLEEKESNEQEQMQILKSTSEQCFFYRPEEHRKLGEDLGKVFARFISSKANQRRINLIVSKYLQILHNQMMTQFSFPKRKTPSILGGNINDQSKNQKLQEGLEHQLSIRQESAEIEIIDQSMAESKQRTSFKGQTTRASGNEEVQQDLLEEPSQNNPEQNLTRSTTKGEEGTGDDQQLQSFKDELNQIEQMLIKEAQREQQKVNKQRVNDGNEEEGDEEDDEGGFSSSSDSDEMEVLKIIKRKKQRKSAAIQKKETVKEVKDKKTRKAMSNTNQAQGTSDNLLKNSSKKSPDQRKQKFQKEQKPSIKKLNKKQEQKQKKISHTNQANQIIQDKSRFKGELNDDILPEIDSKDNTNPEEDDSDVQYQQYLIEEEDLKSDFDSSPFLKPKSMIKDFNKQTPMETNFETFDYNFFGYQSNDLKINEYQYEKQTKPQHKVNQSQTEASQFYIKNEQFSNPRSFISHLAQQHASSFKVQLTNSNVSGRYEFSQPSSKPTSQIIDNLLVIKRLSPRSTNHVSSLGGADYPSFNYQSSAHQDLVKNIINSKIHQFVNEDNFLLPVQSSPQQTMRLSDTQEQQKINNKIFVELKQLQARNQQRKPALIVTKVNMNHHQSNSPLMRKSADKSQSKSSFRIRGMPNVVPQTRNQQMGTQQKQGMLIQPVLNYKSGGAREEYQLGQNERGEFQRQDESNQKSFIETSCNSIEMRIKNMSKIEKEQNYFTCQNRRESENKDTSMSSLTSEAHPLEGGLNSHFKQMVKKSRDTFMNISSTDQLNDDSLYNFRHNKKMIPTQEIVFNSNQQSKSAAKKSGQPMVIVSQKVNLAKSNTAQEKKNDGEQRRENGNQMKRNTKSLLNLEKNLTKKKQILRITVKESGEQEKVVQNGRHYGLQTKNSRAKLGKYEETLVKGQRNGDVSPIKNSNVVSNKQAQKIEMQFKILEAVLNNRV